MVSTGTWAQHSDKSFQGTSDLFGRVDLGGEERHNNIGKLWLKLKDGKVIELATITEEQDRLLDFAIRNGRGAQRGNVVVGSKPEQRIYQSGLGSSGAVFIF